MRPPVSTAEVVQLDLRLHLPAGTGLRPPCLHLGAFPINSKEGTRVISTELSETQMSSYENMVFCIHRVLLLNKVSGTIHDPFIAKSQRD